MAAIQLARFPLTPLSPPPFQLNCLAAMLFPLIHLALVLPTVFSAPTKFTKMAGNCQLFFFFCYFSLYVVNEATSTVVSYICPGMGP